MARAELRPLEAAAGPCPSCGAAGHPRQQLVTAKGRVAWDGCAFCWGLAARRGQAETLRQLCREADRETKAGPNVRALLG